MNTFGENIKISIFGESHGKAVGCIIDGLGSGIALNMNYIMKFMARRKSDGVLGTRRIEEDIPVILSGVTNGITNGFPLAIMIENKNVRSKDYDNDILPRPSHADYVALIKHKGFADLRGGGHFSGRLTAPLVFAGAICSAILKNKGITIGSHISRIADLKDVPFEKVTLSENNLSLLSDMKIPLNNKLIESEIIDCIENARDQGDSVGGIIECGIHGIEAGVGSPFFRSVESTLSSMLFSVPAVKGVEFGAGFDFAKMKGSVANDNYCNDDNEIRTTTNNNGGINGGITNGMPIIFSCAIKPTPSISKLQKSVNLNTNKEQEISIVGRHDPCIVLRALPVIEAVTAIAILDLIMDN